MGAPANDLERLFSRETASVLEAVQAVNIVLDGGKVKELNVEKGKKAVEGVQDLLTLNVEVRVFSICLLTKTGQSLSPIRTGLSLMQIAVLNQSVREWPGKRIPFTRGLIT